MATCSGGRRGPVSVSLVPRGFHSGRTDSFSEILDQVP
jgi:hypothetical protein